MLCIYYVFDSESSDDDNKPKSKKSLESQSKLSKKYKSKDAPVDYTPNPVLDDFSFSTNERFVYSLPSLITFDFNKLR